MRISQLVRAVIAVLFGAVMLAGIFFVRTPADERAAEAAREATVREQLHAIAGLVSRARARSRAPLLRITGNPCSDCVCRGPNLKAISDTHPCARAWAHALASVEAAAGEVGAGSAFRRDAWGSPYALNENQGEVGNCGTPDNLRSVGKDGVWGTPDDVAIDLPLADACP